MSIVPARPWHGDPRAATLVFGVLPTQDPDVVRSAAALADSLSASLVCVWADPRNIIVNVHPDGSIATIPMDPDAVDDADVPTDEEQLFARLEEALVGVPTPWRFHYASGAPARALHESAEDLDAVAIAIGTRQAGFGHWAIEKIDGSVAVRLAHHQHRPVVLIPRPEDGHKEERP
ncbi:universal stress protein [Demequina sp.]|uniref:universal stress protein n=1 Tax=Demequina sp. TaxID=2050685 RepID=UPI0025BBCAC3|nr:universal stress protein [Demequina sp.]